MKICNKCEDVLITIVDGVFSGSEICLTCLIEDEEQENKNGEKMKEDFLNDIEYKEMQLIIEEEEEKMNRIKESDLKIYLNKGKMYYEHDGVEKLRQKYEQLRKEVLDSE